jgi:hypothetical protein
MGLQFFNINGATSGGVTNVTATPPITSTGGDTPDISTSMNTNKMIGRSSAGVGVMEEISIGNGLSLSGGVLSNTATPTPTGYYLSISDSTTQENPTANIPRAIKFNTIDLANGFSLQNENAVFTGTINNGGAGSGTTLNVTNVASGTIKVGMVLTGGSITSGTFISAFLSGTGGVGTYIVSISQNRTSATYTGTMTSQIVVANTGIYNLQFSSQFDKLDSGVDYVDLWLRKNGNDVSSSAGAISLQGNSPAYMMASWNYVIELIGGDIIELYWASADINLQIFSNTNQISPYPRPAIQSTILTITQQAGIMAGTGITALNGLTSDVQTFATGTTGTDFNISSSGSTHTFNIPSASNLARGLVSILAQTFAGVKTFLSAPILDSLTASRILATDGSKAVQSLDTATYPSLTELSYVKGVTSAIQTQINSKISVSKSVLFGNFGSGSVGAGATLYGGFVKSTAFYSAAQAFQARTVLPIACVGKNLTINIGTQPASGSAVFTIRIDGVDSAYTLTIAAGSVTGTYQNTASSINFSNGATIDVKIQNNASSSTGAIVALSMIIEI